jgi:hypothetical protein
VKSGVARGLLVGVLQLMIVGSLAAKFAHDRATRPRVWVKVGYYDPDLPIRGRYAALQVELDTPGLFPEKPLVEDLRNETPATKSARAAAELSPGTQGSGAKARYFPVWDSKPVRLEVHDGKLIALADPKSNLTAQYSRDGEGYSHIFLQDQIDFFVPENATNVPGWHWSRDPLSHTEWWAEVTIPKTGPPRPIRLGIKRSGEQIMPLPAS